MKVLITSCILLAAQSHSLPPSVLVGIYKTEGGSIGAEVGPNKNGSYDLGPMQINTLWIDLLSEKWGISAKETRKRLKYNACANVKSAAFILKRHQKRSGSLFEAIAMYHSRTPEHGYNYRQRVLANMQKKGLLRIPENSQE